MSIWRRGHFYKKTEDGNEYDYLTSELHNMKLGTVEVFMIDAVTENRADLISLKFFGNYHMGWLIGLHNDIEDITVDLKSGKRINIPSIDDYYRFYNRYTR